MRRLLLLLLCLFVVGDSFATAPPKNGGALPPEYLARRGGRDRVTRGWVEKVRRIRDARLSYLADTPANGTSVPLQFQVGDSLNVPVLLAQFSNRPGSFLVSDLQTELFDGPFATGTVTDYFNEVSYGALTVGGLVTNWVTLLQSDAYYEGTSKGLSPGNARTGELIKEVLDANDAAVDFGNFDNDGPDGVPNSGDDDGFVDMLVVVHSEAGSECDNGSNIWSHTDDYRLWPASGGVPYQTNDASMAGGFIRVQDYSIQGGNSCSGGMIEIGPFCHVTGHALGLPDLFHPDPLGPVVVGYWGVMSHGASLAPTLPSHPIVWSKMQMGWVVPTDVGGQGSTQSIDNIENNATAYRLAFSDDRFRRTTECAINGSYSLRCGLDVAEAAARNWPGGDGYGNDWTEVVERSFEYDGNLPVALSFAYTHDLETDFDFVRLLICVDGGETELKQYDGVGNSTDNIDLSTVLSAVAAPATYTIKFRMTSDNFASDEDDNYLSDCGAMVIDDLSVMGGGETYSTDFEASVDGWQQNPTENAPSEYWLVENRQQIGFDASMLNSGLLVWHIDEGTLGTSIDSVRIRGIVLEEADGAPGELQQLGGAGGNKGDTGDPFPGASNNTTFDATSNPNSNSNTGSATVIEVSSIGASGSTMTAFMRAGDPAPTGGTVTPDSLDNDLVAVSILVTGNKIRPGATVRLTMSGQSDIVPLSILWHDTDRIEATLNIFSQAGGDWDLIVTNPDGQSFTLPAAVNIAPIVPAQLVFASISLIDAGVRVDFELFDQDDDESVIVSRSRGVKGPWQRLDGEPREITHNTFEFVDRVVESGATYFYRLDVRNERGETRELFRGSATVPARDVVLEQNYPNPFNPTTTISYFLPNTTRVTLEVFDISGARIRTLSNGIASPGPHRQEWDGRDDTGNVVGTGVYVYRLQAGKTTTSRKMLLLK